MNVASKLLQLSIILPLMIGIAWSSADYRNSQNRPFDYQKYSDSVKQLEMRIGVMHEQWDAEDPIIVSVYLTNKGKSAVKIPDAKVPLFKYQMSVIDEHSRQVPITESMKKQLKWGPSSIRSQEIEPRETIEEKVRISDIFQLNQKGTYKITFKRQVGIADKVRQELTSNTITVSVVE